MTSLQDVFSEVLTWLSKNMDGVDGWIKPTPQDIWTEGAST